MRIFEASALVAGLALLGCGEVKGVDLDADEGNPADSPTITAISPDRGGLAGGQTVQITGAGFIEGTRVVIGGREATAILDSDTQLSVETPPGDNPGATVDVLVFNENGTGMMPASFTYNRVPTVSRLAPRIGGVGGATTVTVTGTGFMVDNPGTPGITVGGIAATDVTVVDDETITFVTGAASATDAGVAQDVEIRTGNGTVTLEGHFAYVVPGLIVGNRRRDGIVGSTFRYVDPASDVVIDLDDGVATFPFSVSRMSYGPGGALRVLTNQHGRAHSLVEVDLSKGEWEFIGLATSGTVLNRSHGFAFNGSTMYMVNNSNLLGTLDETNGSYTALGGPSLLTSGRGGCIVRRDAASLWYAAGLASELRIVSVADGSVVPGGPVMNDSNSNYCHGAAFFESTLHFVVEHRSVSCCGNTRLFSVDTATGAVVERRALPRSSAGVVPTPPGF